MLPELLLRISRGKHEGRTADTVAEACPARMPPHHRSSKCIGNEHLQKMAYEKENITSH